MPNPLDDLLENLREAIEDTAREFLKDVNKEAKRTVRNMSRVTRQASRPLPRGNKQARTVPPATDQGKSHRPARLLLYDVLEVSPRASQETVSAAFRSLSARFHPDNKKTGNGEKYKDITAAWSTLKDPVKRKRYDRENGLV